MGLDTGMCGSASLMVPHVICRPSADQDGEITPDRGEINSLETND